jgi:hypothetical protein
VSLKKQPYIFGKKKLPKKHLRKITLKGSPTVSPVMAA